MDGLDIKGARREVAEESQFGAGAETGTEQVDDLGEDEGRDDQRAGIRLQ